MTVNERLLLANQPHHLVRETQSGRDIFVTEAHYDACIRDIRSLARRYRVRLHAWALMPDSFHLVATPEGEPQVLSTLMKSISCRASLRLGRYRARQKTATAEASSPWDSRFLSSPIEQGQWLLTTMCFVEKLPAEAGLADTAFHYHHSSYRMRLGKTEHYWLDDPEEYARLGDSLAERAQAYRNYIKIGLDSEAREMVVTAVKRGKLTGSERFVEQVFREHGIYVPNRGPGRPPKKSHGKLPEQSSEKPPGKPE